MRSRAKRGNQNDERTRERHRNCVNLRDVWLKCRIMSHGGQTASISPGILDPIGKPVATAHDQSPAQKDFVVPYGIGSVLGFGGMGIPSWASWRFWASRFQPAERVREALM